MKPVARSADLIVKNLDGELIVYDERTSEAHELNATASLIWRHCDGKRSVDDLAEIVGSESSLPADEEIVRDGLGRLSRVGLLERGPAQIPAVSRRRIISRLGLAGAAAVLFVTDGDNGRGPDECHGPVDDSLNTAANVSAAGDVSAAGAPTPAPTTSAPTPPPPPGY